MNPRTSIAIGILALMIAVGIAAGRVGSLQGDRVQNASVGRRAPEFAGIERWLNGEPLTIDRLRGKVVLIDFWTYSCVNCVRTFDGLRALHRRYADAGLQIVGVHSPEFDFEKDPARVRAAVARHRLPYPVAMDNDMATWRAYRNNYWPHVYLIDTQGEIRFDHIGEGGEEEIEENVRALLDPLPGPLPAPLRAGSERRAARGITREIYAGYERGGREGSLGNDQGFSPEEVFDYPRVEDDQVRRAGTAGVFFLEGSWRASPEYVEAVSGGARVLLRFKARDVFVVAGAAEAAPVSVLLDGERTPIRSYRGHPSGEQVVVQTPDLYRLISLGTTGTHTLVLNVSPGFRLYTFTFG